MEKLADQYPVDALVETLEVSESGFAAHRRKHERPRRRHDATLRVLVRQSFEQSRSTYGSPRVRLDLRDQGHRCGKNRIARLMREQRLRPRQKRRFRPTTTDSRHAQPVAPNWLAKVPAPDQPGQIWQSDLTYIPTAEGLDVYYFLGLGGAYRGPVAAGSEFGRVDIDLSRTGTATGRFEWQGQTFPFRAAVDLRGRLQVQKPKSAGGALLVLDVILDPVLRELRGTFTDFSAPPQALVANVRLIRAPVVPVGRIQKAAYTTFIDPPPVVEGGLQGVLATRADQFPPDGAGFSVVRVTKKGGARFAGRLPDDEIFTHGFQRADLVDEDVAKYDFDQLPLYTRKKTARGRLDGEVRLRPGQPEAAFDAVLTQQRNAGVATSFANGFTILSALSGGRFPNIASGLPPGYTERDTNAVIRISRGGLEQTYRGFLRITSGRIIVREAPRPMGDPDPTNALQNLKVKFVGGSGLSAASSKALFRGSFTSPLTGETVKFNGATHGSGGRSRGTFSRADRTGLVEIEPF